MNSLFGLSMTAIMVALLVALGVCLMSLAGLFFANRTMFHMGMRNVSRRRTQSVLVITGLMLATVIITASFTTGDAIDYSATKASYDVLQRTDISLHHFRPVSGNTPFDQTYAPDSVTGEFEQRFAGSPDIEGFMPFLYIGVPVLNQRTKLAEPEATLAGADMARQARFGGLQLVNGQPADLASLGEDETFLGKRMADKLDAVPGDMITIFSQGQTWPLKVAGIVHDERASGELEFGPNGIVSGMAVQLTTAQRITGHPGQINVINVALRGGVRGGLDRTDAAADALTAVQKDDRAKQAMGLGGLAFQVEKVKQDAVNGSRLAANVFTTIFLALGLFSIAAGTLLIFTLFVMLAAERRTEMGIARAVGAQRSHLVQSFVAEGAVYDIFAGLAGVALGVAAGVALILGARAIAGESLDVMRPHITARSLVVSFCLGGILTFITVVVSSVRISQLNVVAAIRGQSDPGGSANGKPRRHWAWLVLGVPAMLIPPLGIYLLFRRGLGLSWYGILAPGGIVFGVLLTLLGGFSHLAFPYMLGLSLVVLSSAAVARNAGASARAAWSSGGLVLAILWLVPVDISANIFGKFEATGMEMFVLSGIMIVTGLTLLIVFNARLLTVVFAAQRRGAQRYLAPAVLGAASLACVLFGVFQRDVLGGLGQLAFLLAIFAALFALLSLASARFNRFAPAFKMAVAYPLANRFRTGMTIAMFSIVVFSITTMGIINGSFLQMFTSSDGRAGWDIQVSTNRNNPITDLKGALADAGMDTSAIAAVGSVTSYDDNAQQARQPGGSWVAYPILTGDQAFYQNATMKMQARAQGYTSDRAVLDAVGRTPGLAIMDAAPLQESTFTGGIGLSVSGVDISPGTFKPFPLEIRDPVTGKSATVTVVGVLSAKIALNAFIGVYTNEATYRQVLGDPSYQMTFVRLQPGADAVRTAKMVKAALVTRGVQATSIQEQIDSAVSTSVGFLRIFQAFMALGLFVGIAALGVIALRSVVERRQQIGMLRAIGYQQGTVALSFLLESGFIALMGIFAGIVGATLLSWRLIVGGEFAGAEELGFFVPWSDIAIEVVAAFVVALLMTWWPSRQASNVPIAEALRYE